MEESENKLSVLKELKTFKTYPSRDYEDLYWKERKANDALKRNFEYCTFKMYLKGLKNRIKRRFKIIDLVPIHKGGVCWYKSINLFGNRYMFIKKFDKSLTYFSKEYYVKDEDQHYIKFYYIKRDGKYSFTTEIREDNGERTSC